MLVNAKTFFSDGFWPYQETMVNADTNLPREFATVFRQRAVGYTPRKTAWLRRSIITQVNKGNAQVGWRAQYAIYQNRGGHMQRDTIEGYNERDGGWGRIRGPRYYTYSQWTTAGTGPHFKEKAFEDTVKQIPAVMRRLGLTK